MSHFTVAVFTRDEHQSIDDLLAPFDENVTVEPYVSVTKEDLIKRTRERIQSVFANQYFMWNLNREIYEMGAGPEHIEYLRSIPGRMQWTDRQIYEDAIQSYDEEDVTSEGSILSRHNPNSKWDWYTIGGRWQGMLLLKPDKTGERGEAGLTNQMTSGYDAAYVADIDFAAMRKRQYAKVRPYSETLENDLYAEERSREQYPSEHEYYRQMTGFNTYAVITPDGEWHAPGNMGWFGMSSESDTARRCWDNEYYERFINPALENGWYLTIVDCHI